MRQLRPFFEQAIQAFSRALELDPTNPDFYSSLASLLVDTGRGTEARALIQLGLERYPNSAESHIVAADFYMAIGEVDEAISLYERSIELAPEDGWTYASFARAVAGEGDFSRSRRLLEDAAGRNPGDPWLDEFIGWIYLDIGDCERAIEAFSRALEMNPTIDSAEQGIRECGG